MKFLDTIFKNELSDEKILALKYITEAFPEGISGYESSDRNDRK
ncbi:MULTISPECIES: hypothetical protein [Pseudomonas]|nr:hypothetical protein [Pseudomonas sp. R3.Fl]